MGPLIPLFWTSGDVSSGFQNQSGHPYSLLAEAYLLQYLSDIDLESYIKVSGSVSMAESAVSLSVDSEDLLVGLSFVCIISQPGGVTIETTTRTAPVMEIQSHKSRRMVCLHGNRCKNRSVTRAHSRRMRTDRCSDYH